MNAMQVAELWAGKAEPILPSVSLERTLAFWTGLGFSSGVWEDDEGYAWVFPGGEASAGIHIDYSLTEDHNPFTFMGMAYLTVNDVDAIYKAVASSGVAEEALDAEGLFKRSMQQLREQWEIGQSLARYTRPINQSWGKRELALFDPDNNLIRIGATI